LLHSESSALFGTEAANAENNLAKAGVEVLWQALAHNVSRPLAQAVSVLAAAPTVRAALS
jgi:hypothetical protein